MKERMSIRNSPVKSKSPSSIRNKAEEHLKKKKLNSGSFATDSDAHKLLHELEVYQIELEMQNDELKAARDSAEKAMENYSSLFDYSPAGYFVITKEGNIRNLNFMGANMLGMERLRLINTRFKLFLSFDTRNTFDDFMHEVFECRCKSSCEVIIVKKDSLPLYIYIEGSVNAEDNELLAIMFDITNRKAIEEELKISNEKLELAMENGNIGVWEWDITTDRVTWDKRMEKIFDFLTGSFGQTYKAFEDCIHEEDLLHFRKAINQTLEMELPFETVFRTRSVTGDSKYVSTKALVNKGKDGKTISLTGVCFDVTGMKKGTEQVLIKLNEELLRSNKDLEQFAYVASHDLQEPLRMVSSFTQMLAQHYENKLDKEAQEYIKFAVDGSKRMYELINGLLAYSRIQTKGKKFARVNMNDVLEKVIRNLSLIIEEKNVVIAINEFPEIFADESQMIQLIQNLISNAIKFSTKAPVIHILSKTEGKKYVFSVKDEGIGIDTQYFERIFLIFQRLMPKDEYEGTGIGLAICKRIVERHGGNIWVESEPGKGSTFCFTIPKNDDKLKNN